MFYTGYESANARRILTAVPRVIGEGQLGDPTPPGWPLWRTTYLCTTLPWRMLSSWLWISRCGDYWQQAELRTDGACRIMMMMMTQDRPGRRPLKTSFRRYNFITEVFMLLQFDLILNSCSNGVE